MIFTECTPVIDSMLPRWQLALHRRLAGRADGLIATSSAARARLLAFGVPEDKVAVALQAADVERFRAAQLPEPRTAGDRSTVLSAGRLVPDKNFGPLIEAFATAGLTPSQAQLDIAGTGFLEDDLEQLANRFGVPVRLHGHRSPDALPQLYAGRTCTR